MILFVGFLSRAITSWFVVVLAREKIGDLVSNRFRFRVREPVGAIFPWRSKKLIRSHPGVRVGCYDEFFVDPTTTVKDDSGVRPSEFERKTANLLGVFVIPEFFIFDAVGNDFSPFVNGNGGVPFECDKLLDVLAEVMKGITLPEDSIGGKGSWLANVGRAGEKFAPVVGCFVDSGPIA